MDPEVEIKAIELAHEWAKLINQPIDSIEKMIDEKARRFDRAYKAIIKTLGYTEQATSPPTNY